MNTMVEHINSAGFSFVEFALPMLIQSSVLIAILLLADLLLRKKVKAVFRYWIWMLVLAKLILPASLSSPLSLGYLFGDKLTYQDLAQSSATLEPTKPAQADISLGIEPLFIQPNPYIPPTVPVISVVEPSIAEPVSPPAPVTPVTWQGVVFLIWLAVVIAMGLLLLQRALFVRGLVAQAKKAGRLMNDELAYCCAGMRIKGKVGLKVSPNATTPSVCGLIRPVILVPWNLTSTLGASRMRTVLMHELAHIKRADLWANLAQTILQIIYFYNPLLWLANCMIRRIREQAVDEAVLVAMGDKARQYPQTLVDVAKLAFKRPALSLRLIGVVESKSALAGRIKHILGRPMPRTAKLGVIGVLAILIAGAVLLPMARAEKNQKLLRGIDEKLKVTDKAGELTINSLYMPSPNGKDIIGANKVTMYVDVTNNSEKDIYLGLEYYTDSGTIAKVFSPGASSLAQIKRVPASWQGKLEYPIYYRRFVKGGYIKITLARCAGKQIMKEKGRAVLPPEVEVIYEKKHNIVSIDDTQPDEGVLTDSSFTATLPNGVTVELVGVCEHPSEGKQWWKPDGDELLEAPYDEIGGNVYPDGDEKSFEFAIILGNLPAERVNTKVRCEESVSGSAGGSSSPQKNGEYLSDLRWLATTFPKKLKACTVKVGVAAGQWQPVAESNGKGVGSRGSELGGVSFTKAFEVEDGISITVADDILGRPCRVVAITNDGEVVKPVRSSGSSAGKVRQTTAKFNNISLSDIKQFQFQTRPYEWVEFKEVSLRPGVKTDVQVEGGLKKPKPSPKVATLPNGVTVELVGVCEHPSEGKQWWLPDGSLLGQSPVMNIDVGGYNIRRGEAAYELVTKLTGPETLLRRSFTPEKWKIPQARKVGLGKSGKAKDKNGVPCLRATTAIVKNGLDKIDIEFGLAGVWEKRLTISSNESSKQKIRDTGVVINPPYEKNSNATVTIKIPNKIDSKMAINITAVLKNGKVIDSAAWSRNSKFPFMRSTDNYEFYGINLSDVDHFEIYTSKYQWVEFKNVSLKPNVKTDVQVAYSTTVTRRIRQAGKPDSGRDETYEFLTEPNRKTRLLNPKEWGEMDNWVSIVASVVKDSGRYLLPKDEELTLSELIRAAGYDPQKLPVSFLEIMRPVKLGQVRAYSIFSRNLETLFSKKESDPVLKRHDSIVGGWIYPTPNRDEFLAQYSFGDVVELIINDDNSENNMFVDLDAGKLVTPANDLDNRDEEAVTEWMKNKGVDALGEIAPDVRGLVGFDMVALSVDNHYWGLGADAVVARLAIKNFDFPILMRAEADLPATYLIKTREYGLGVLQIIAFTDKPKGVKIRYKMVQKKSAKKTDVQVEGESGWGEAVEGVQMRVRPERQRWYEGETPKFRVDMRNKGTVEWKLGLTQSNWEVELDGLWHRVGVLWSGWFQKLLLGPGQEHKDIEFYPGVWSEWNINGRPLKFSPGSHTVRLSFVPSTGDRANWRRLRVVSNAVVIEVLPAEADKRDWGEAVAGLQCGLRADKRLWKADETPRLQAVARNVGRDPWRLPEFFFLKVAGKIWRWKGPGPGEPVELKPGEDLDKTTILLSSEDWVPPYESDFRLKLSPGKHIVQLVIIVSVPVPPEAGPVTIPVSKQLRIESNVVVIEVLPTGSDVEQKTDVQVSAPELVAKIIESERKIEDIQLHMTCTIPARNLVFCEFDWGYDGGKEFYTGFRNSTEPGRNEISRTTQITRAFDGQNEWSLRVSSEDKQPRGAIFKPSFSLRSTMTFNTTLLGFEAKERSRLSFGEAIAQAESISVRDKVEFIDGHPCYVIEAVNLETDPSVNWAYDVRAWIDYQRNYRLLKFEKCKSISGKNRFKVVARRVDNIKLKQIGGIWLPTEGRRTTFYTNDNGPPRGMSLARFAALSAQEQDRVGVFKLIPMSPPRRLEVDVESIRLNKGIPPERFTIAFPDGCEVYNEFTGKRYVVGQPSEREAALSDAEWIERMAGLSVSELIDILHNSSVGKDKKKWFAAVHRLVEIGPTAVPELVAELRQTEKPQTQSRLALTLRAIGDPKAVPGLIDGLGRSGFSSDYGIGEPRTELDMFFKQHQLDPAKKSLGLSRPVREITIALEKLTGHTEGHDHFYAYDLKYDRLGSYTITPEIRDRQRQHRRQVAQRWRKWWQANKDNIEPTETLPKPPAESKPARSEKLEKMIMAAPEGSILTLAVVPNVDGSGRRPSLTKEEYQRHLNDLAQNGPFSGSIRGDSFQWSPVKGDSTRFRDLPLSTYKERNYLLLCARAQYVMMPELEGKWAWGLEKVEAAQDGNGKPTISIRFDEKGSELFYELTRANIGNHLAIAVDGWVLSAPTIETSVRKSAVIRGDFTEQQIRTFVEDLRKGMTPVDQQTVKEMQLIAEAAEKLNKQDVAKMGPRRVVESFLIAGLAGLNEKLVWFVRPGSAVDKILDGTDLSEELLDGHKIKVVNVYAGGKDAFAITSDITDQYGERLGKFMFYLSNENGSWLIYDLDAGEADRVRENLTEFLSTHPDVHVEVDDANPGFKALHITSHNDSLRIESSDAQSPIVLENGKVSRVSSNRSERFQATRLQLKLNPVTIELDGPRNRVRASGLGCNAEITPQNDLIEVKWSDGNQTKIQKGGSLKILLPDFQITIYDKAGRRQSSLKPSQSNRLVSGEAVQTDVQLADMKERIARGSEQVRAIDKMLREWFGACVAGDVESMKKAYSPGYQLVERDMRQINELLGMNPGWQFSLLAAMWDKEKAMAVSGALEHGDPKVGGPMVLVWTFSNSEDKWGIIDIDLEELEGLQIENSRFMQKHPNAQVWFDNPDLNAPKMRQKTDVRFEEPEVGPVPIVNTVQNKVTLHNGVTVKLVGVCEHPSEGKQWWRADGSLLQEKPYGTIKGDRVFFGTNERAYEFVVRVAGPTDVGLKWKAVPDGGSRMTSFPHGSDGRLLPDLRVLITKFHRRTDRALVRIGVTQKVPDKDVTQDYEWVEFKDVSLRPGHKTDVQVEGEYNNSLYQKQGSIRYVLEFIGTPEELIDTTFISKHGQLANPRQLEFANKLFSVRKSKDVDMFISLLSDGTKKQLNDGNNRRMLHNHIKEIKEGTFLRGQYDFKFFATFREFTDKDWDKLKEHVSFAEPPTHAIVYYHFHRGVLLGSTFYLIEDNGSYKFVAQTLLSGPVIPVKEEQPTVPKEYGIVAFKQTDNAYTQPAVWKYKWNIEISSDVSENNVFQILRTTKVVSGQAELHPEIAAQKIIDESIIEKYKYDILKCRFYVGDSEPRYNYRKYGRQLSGWAYGFSIASWSRSTSMLFPGKDVTNVKPNKQGNFIGSDLELLSFETSEENIRYEHKVILRKDDSPEAKSAALLRLEQMTRRRISNKKLQYLDGILTTYANDHNSIYPDRLEQIKAYDTDEWLDWLLENIEYLGKGKTLTETSNTVIAYDKTLLEKAGSTNVLFNEGPVQYCNPNWLKKLGITGVHKSDVQVEGESRVSKLLTALQNEKYVYIREPIIQMVEEIGDKEPISFLTEQLNSENRRRRCYAAFALELAGDRRGVPAIIKELNDTSYRPTTRIRSDGREYQEGQITQDHYYAAVLLGILGDERAVPALIEAIKHDSIDWCVAQSLGQIGDKRAVPVLHDMLDKNINKPFQRLYAGYGLAMLADEEGLKVVIDTLNNQQVQWSIRRYAIDLLGKLADKQAVPHLIIALKDDHPNIRVSAARALGAIEDASALPALEEALKDNTETKVNAPTTVSKAAAEAIAQIKAGDMDKTDMPVTVESGNESTESKGAEPTKSEPAKTRGGISGVVVHSITGEPIAGAYVGVGDFGDSGGSNYSRHRSQGFHDKTKTDEKGRFELDGLAFTDDHPYLKYHPLVVTHPDFVRHDEKFELLKDKPAPDVKVSIRPAAKIDVTIVDAQGNPLKGHWLIRLEALDGRRFIPPGSDPHLSSFASSVWIERPKPVPAKKSLSGTTGFSFTELDRGQYSIDVMEFAITDNYTPPPPGMVRLPLDTSKVSYYGGMTNVKIEAGRTKEVRIKPADYQTSVSINMPEDPIKKQQIPPFVLISRNTGLLLWNDGKTHGPEDHRLGRLQKNALYYNLVVEADVFTIKNLPPGSYSVFAGPIYFMSATRMEVSRGREVVVDMPPIQITEHAKVGLWTFDRKVKLEAGDYSVSELCELLTDITKSNPRLIADSSIENEKLSFGKSEMSVWDVLEKLYLDKGWKLGEVPEKTLILEAEAGSTAKKRRVYLPDLETPRANVILDLATGEMLQAMWLKDNKVAKIGKGDVVYEYSSNRSSLLCLRGATMQLRTNAGLNSLKVDIQREYFAGYFLTEVPCQYQVTTAEGDKYELKVISIDKGDTRGACIQFWKSEKQKTNVQVES
ncbi:MAG TPA: hypothetical protein HPP66_04820 [Planctomycetes bacterium]|nr:hypothetical protein [Planctomycetota bacterium]